MTTTIAPNIENFCVTLHPLGEFEDISLPAPENADDIDSETGWEFQLSLGVIVGEDEDADECFRMECVWVKCGLFRSLSLSLDELICAANNEAQRIAGRRRHAVPFWRLHDVRRGGVSIAVALLK